MSKALFIVLVAVLMSGCELKQLVLPPEQHKELSCIPGSMAKWVAQEQQYQQASPHVKALLLKQAAANEQTVILAIMLSQPDNTTAQLKRSIALFEQLKLNNTPQCDTEQYLLVRYRYTQAVMTLQRALNTADLERKALSTERDKLKQQIEALTRIENDLSH